MSTQQQALLQLVGVEEYCAHLLVRWDPPHPSWWRRQRIVESTPCAAVPATTLVTTNCLNCGRCEQGYWCAKCLRDEAHEYEHGPLWCQECDQFCLTLKLG